MSLPTCKTKGLEFCLCVFFKNCATLGLLANRSCWSSLQQSNTLSPTAFFIYEIVIERWLLSHGHGKGWLSPYISNSMFTRWIHSLQSASLYVLFWSLCLFFFPAPQTSGTKTESKVMQPTCGTLKLLRKMNPSHPLSYQPATFLRKWTTQKKEEYLISTIRKEKEKD